MPELGRAKPPRAIAKQVGRRWAEAFWRIHDFDDTLGDFLVYACALLQMIGVEQHPVYERVVPDPGVSLPAPANVADLETRYLVPLVASVRKHIPMLDHMFGEHLPREVRRFALSYLSRHPGTDADVSKRLR